MTINAVSDRAREPKSTKAAASPPDAWLTSTDPAEGIADMSEGRATCWSSFLMPSCCSLTSSRCEISSVPGPRHLTPLAAQTERAIRWEDRQRARGKSSKSLSSI